MTSRHSCHGVCPLRTCLERRRYLIAYLSEAERRQVEVWIGCGFIRVAEQGLLAITEAGERAYWAPFPGAREQEMMDVLDENVLGVLADAERGLSLDELAKGWSHGVLLLTPQDILGTLDRWREGQWKYKRTRSLAWQARAAAAYDRLAGIP